VEDIFYGLVILDFDVVSVKQMIATYRLPPDVSEIINMPLFLVTLPRTAKSQEIFSVCQASATLLSGWRLIEPRILLPSATTASSSAMSRLIANNLPTVCGAGADTCTMTGLPREGKRCFQPTCCNFQLVEGEKAHPDYYRGCRHSNEQLQKRKSQRTPRTIAGRVFSSNLTTPGVSFVVELRGSTQQ
jgi:hypothetical protein